MQEEIKCPQCGGNRFSLLDDTTYKCMYCGTTFQKKEEKVTTTPPTNPTQQSSFGEPMESARSYYQINGSLYGNDENQNSVGRGCIIAVLIMIGIPILLLMLGSRGIL